MITVTKRFKFEAAHFLPYYDGACANMHGHSYHLDVTVIGDLCTDTNNPKCGMIIDFKDLKALVNNSSSASALAASLAHAQTATSIRMTVSVIVVLPIICVYPIFQRYFTKGIMIGAVKG